MKLEIRRIYLDTNIFDALTKDECHRKDTERLFNYIENGKFEAYYSQTAVEEILMTTNKNQKMRFKNVLEEKIYQKKCVKLIPTNDENFPFIHKLANAYQTSFRGLIRNSAGIKFVWKWSHFSKGGSQVEDRWHIAIAVVNNIGTLVTWDEELTKEKITNWVNKVNRELGYSGIGILLPPQLIKLETSISQ